MLWFVAKGRLRLRRSLEDGLVALSLLEDEEWNSTLRVEKFDNTCVDEYYPVSME